MAPAELQKLILKSLDEQSGHVQRIEEKVDKMSAESSRQFGELNRLLHQHDKMLDRHELLITSAETRLERLDNGFSTLADQSGKFELAGLQSKLEEALATRQKLEDGRTHWVRWVVTTAAGVLIAILGALLGAKYGG